VVEVAFAHDLHVADARFDRSLAHRPQHPLDEAAGDDERDDAERARGDRERAAPRIAQDVAQGEARVMDERSRVDDTADSTEASHRRSIACFAREEAPSALLREDDDVLARIEAATEQSLEQQ